MAGFLKSINFKFPIFLNFIHAIIFFVANLRHFDFTQNFSKIKKFVKKFYRFFFF